MSYNRNASQEVSEFIAQNIRSGVWKPGDKIWSENEFCSNLPVSRIAVRDAIANLTAISVLRKIRGSGTYVEDLDNASLEGTRYFALNIEDVLDLMELRYVLEPYCTRLFIERATADELQELSDCYENMVRNSNNDKKDYYSNRFHYLITLGSKNKFIVKIMDYLNDNMLSHQQLLSKGDRQKNNEIGTEYHQKILQAIKDKDKEMAEVYSRYHIRLGMEVYRAALEKKRLAEEEAQAAAVQEPAAQEPAPQETAPQGSTQ